MKKIWFFLYTLLVITCSSTLQAEAFAPSRVGVNLGPWTQFGTNSFASNIIMNPGFEGHVDRHIAITTNSDATSFSDEEGRKFNDDHWNGATFEIRSGPYAGTNGVVTNYVRSGVDGLPQFFVEGSLPTLTEKTVISLYKTKSPEKIDNWWVDNTSTAKVDKSTVRHGSKGEQSLRLQRTASTSAKVNSYIDQEASVSGKSLKIDGKWILKFWAKGEGADPVLQVLFRRLNGTPKFFNESISVSEDWQEYSFVIDGTDDGDDATLQFQLTAPNQETTVWVDDIWLGSEDDQNFFFRKQVIDNLKNLKPGFLRELFHLGDSFENRVSDTTNRKAFTVRVKGSENQQWSYGLNNFLDLCEEIGADPWVVIPPPFTDDENLRFGEYLAAHAGPDRFNRVIVEFGNENWNWIYSPLGIPYPEQHGEVADRAFEFIKQGAGSSSHFTYVINGQYVNTDLTKRFIDASQLAEGIAIAPYFLFELTPGLSEQQALAELFEDDPGYLQATADYAQSKGLEVMIYEVNLHTSDGHAPETERNPLVSGMASGTALAKRILDSMKHHYDPINIYNFSQYQTKTYKNVGKVNLWGITRNLTTPPHIRPTGLAMKMINEVIGGETHALTVEPSANLTSLGFKTPELWTAVITSENSTPATITVTFPDDNHPLPGEYLTLNGSSPFDTNEEEEKVTIVRKPVAHSGRTVTVTIPAYGMVSLGLTPIIPEPTPPTETTPSSETTPTTGSTPTTETTPSTGTTPTTESTPTTGTDPTTGSTPATFPYPTASTETEVIIEKTPNLAINLGLWELHRTSQFARNILMNPGFEGRVDRKIVLTSSSDDQSFSDDKSYPFENGFWNGAAFEIRSGPHAGANGKISHFLKSGAGGKPQYFTGAPLPPLEEKTAISLLQTSTPSQVDKWWIENEATVFTDTEEIRPGSDGSQSLRLQPTASTPSKVNSYIDHNAHIAGKSLRIDGDWILNFWAKGEGQDAVLRVFFRRINGSPKFFDEKIYLTNEWKEYSVEFTGSDTGNDAILQFQMSGETPDSTVWVDDIWLGPAEDRQVFFRKTLIDTLKQLSPSYIREFFHLGESFANRTSSPSGRKSQTVLMDGKESVTWSYSLQDFLELCRLTGANPWIVIPTTFTDEENRLLGTFLAEHADGSRFSNVILEFGHENWNWIYRMQGIPYPEIHGEVADRAFEYIKLGAGQASNLTFVINGQAANPELTQQYMDFTQLADGIAVAPNFHYSQDTGLTDQEIINALFTDTSESLKIIAEYAKQKDFETLVYEMNLQTTAGTAQEEERNRAVASRISGSAFAKQILSILENGIEPVAIKKLSEYYVKTHSGNGFVKLAGVTRNLSSPPYFRPTGLVMQMLNRVIGGEMHRLNPGDSFNELSQYLTMAGFKTPDMWTAAIISEHAEEQTIGVEFPNDGHPIPAEYLALSSSSPFDTNEIDERVTIEKKSIKVTGRIAEVTIPAYGFIVLGIAPHVDEGEPQPTSEPEPAPPEPTPEPEPAPEPTPEPAPPEPVPVSEPVPEPTPPEPTPEPEPAPEPTPDPETGTESNEELEQKIRDLEQKQEEILKDLQKYIKPLH